MSPTSPTSPTFPELPQNTPDPPQNTPDLPQDGFFKKYAAPLEAAEIELGEKQGKCLHDWRYVVFEKKYPGKICARCGEDTCDDPTVEYSPDDVIVLKNQDVWLLIEEEMEAIIKANNVLENSEDVHEDDHVLHEDVHEDDHVLHEDDSSSLSFDDLLAIPSKCLGTALLSGLHNWSPFMNSKGQQVGKQCQCGLTQLDPETDKQFLLHNQPRYLEIQQETGYSFSHQYQVIGRPERFNSDGSFSAVNITAEKTNYTFTDKDLEVPLNTEDDLLIAAFVEEAEKDSPDFSAVNITAEKITAEKTLEITAEKLDTEIGLITAENPNILEVILGKKKACEHQWVFSGEHINPFYWWCWHCNAISYENPLEITAEISKAKESLKNTAEKIIAEKTRRKWREGSGCLREEPIKRNGKTYYQWVYKVQYVKNGIRVSQSSYYVPKSKVKYIAELERQKVPVTKIIQALKG